MEVLTRSASVRDRVRRWRSEGSRVALVPTAGTIHKGHMRLIAEAEDRADRIVVSLVADTREAAGSGGNAGPDADPHAARGPYAAHGLRDVEASHHEADRALLQNLGADVLFAPPAQELFPVGTELCAQVDIARLATIFEGAHRPGHIGAGLTLLLKLINIVTPDAVVFGERDFQQLVAVRQMIGDLFVSVEILSFPTFRESDGLALASQNRWLTPEERLLAPQLFATLRRCAERIDAGERDYAGLERDGLAQLSAAGFDAEYFAIRQAVDLAPVHTATRDLVLLAAAALGRVRLTDNFRARIIDRY
jgi:pantoate--beta-alanine ligase